VKNKMIMDAKLNLREVDGQETVGVLPWA